MGLRNIHKILKDIISLDEYMKEIVLINLQCAGVPMLCSFYNTSKIHVILGKFLSTYVEM